MTEEIIENNDAAIDALRTARTTFRAMGMRPASTRRLAEILEEAEEIMTGIVEEQSRRDCARRLVGVVETLEARIADLESRDA